MMMAWLNLELIVTQWDVNLPVKDMSMIDIPN